MAETATVELLTAEVRVLMVGSRQVTLSVAKQLDQVDLTGMEPFGRVRVGDDQRIIGRSRDSGALVLAQFRQLKRHRVWIDNDDLNPDDDSLAVVCDREIAAAGAFSLRFGDRHIRLAEDATSRCGRHPYDPCVKDTEQPVCGSWNPNGNEKHIQAAIDAWEADDALHQQAAALPLIVLAGLK